MISFDDRHGPAEAACASAYPELRVPEWYRDAKLGMFVHWGLYSVPAWADVLDRSDVTADTAYARHQYAEWYANTVRIEGSPTRERHERLHGVGRSYEDFADDWHPAPDAAARIVDLAARAGALYLVPTTKHHDGFCLWDSATTPFTAARRGPGRDLIAELASATRGAGLRLGLYYSGALDWHMSDFPPLTSNDDLFALRRNDPAFAAYAAAQLRELVDRFAPDLLWNDIDWPDAGKHPGPDSLVQLFTEHLAAVPDGLVNDRWGAPVHGVLTREYQDIDAVQDEVFEATRGLGLSFGYNADESAGHALDGPALIRLLVDVVSKNGNLLINVGPRADGSVPPLQSAALEELGAGLSEHGTAIFGTRLWFHEAVRVPPAGVRFTRGPGADRGELLHVFLLDPAAGEVVLDPQVSAALREVAEVPGGSGERVVLGVGAGAGVAGGGDGGAAAGPVGVLSFPVRRGAVGAVS
ncbi:alpha-L-fucosidase [Brachybacterium sp. J144]|uniref:alpha-L-fucosidase n=1 Tax=Brachybacterium sp. J144 TaxID=3116487 RepID=UPI002E76F408|nr:alpha-L-fucosidase [Brachybacterium sp. J144]MEE1650250.1 alpha-L-fucosidase [Brachybacterium sp. J144]